MDPSTPIHTQAHPLPLYAQTQPHETQSSLAQSLLTDAASPQAQASLSQPLPASAVAPSSAFAAAQALAAGSANAVPYVEPPPYAEPPPGKDIPQPTGRVNDGRVRILTDEEIGKSNPAEMKELKRKGPAILTEDKIKSMSVAELRRKGLGRVPSGANTLLSAVI